MLRPTTIVAFVLGVLAVRATGSDQRTDGGGRLPGDTEPVAYGLRLVPRYDKDGDRYTVDGHVEVWIRVNEITPKITMHAKDMYVSSVTVTDVKSETDLKVDSHTMDPDRELLVIYVSKNLLTSRQYQVRMVFHGHMRTDMTGIYKSTYTVNDETVWMAVSRFKPTYARRAFPCYDEPGYKTPFNISIGRKINQMTLSNMRLTFSQRMEYYGIWLDHYEPTKPISTYMVGILVGNLQKSVLPSSDTNISIYTCNEDFSQTAYVLEETPMLYDTMENYTEVRGEVEKVDLLALPDFDPDGAENWGLNSYREKFILFDNETKAKFIERSTMIIEQQLSHQWFGNLVTHSWWSDLWLSEGFARYFQYFVVDLIKQDWRLDHLFVVEQHQTAMAFDQYPRHPITGPVNGYSDILKIFNPITHNKAAAILRMIKYTVTENRFRVPLQMFLNKYKYGVASSFDLWAVFENYYFDTGFQLQEGVQFTDFVTSWTDQVGFPLINVIYENSRSRFKITQTRFSVWPLNSTEDGGWYIGLTFTNNLQKKFTDLGPTKWMNPNTAWTIIPKQNSTTWYIFNIQSTGFYRVNYDQNNWNALIKQLNESCREIHVLNRAQLIDDSFNLARAGILNYSTALNLSTYLVNEDDYLPFFTAIECLTYVVERMRRSAQGYEYMKAYVRNLADTIYNKTEALILEHKSTEHTILTSFNTFSVWACYLDSKHCIRSAMENFIKWSMNERISPDIKDAALCTGIKLNGDENTWIKLLEVYMTTQSASEKNSAQSGLACSQNTTILYKYLDFLSNSTESVVRLQDYKDICDAMSLTPQGIEAMTNYLMMNMERILRYIPTGDTIVTYMYSVLASKVALDSEIIKLYNVKNAYGLPPKIKLSFDESYKHVEQNLLWYNTYHVGINEWLGAPMDPTTNAPETTINSTPIPSMPPSTKPPTTIRSTTVLPTTISPITSPVTTEQVTTLSPITEPTKTISPKTKPETTLSTNTELVTSKSKITEPEMTVPESEKFDFDHTTVRSISRCPDKSGGQSSQPSSFSILVLGISLIASSSMKLVFK